MDLQLKSWICLLYSTTIGWMPPTPPSHPCHPSRSDRYFQLHCLKRHQWRIKGKFSAAPWDKNRFNSSLEDSRRVLHAMSDSDFFSSISADLKSDINIMRSVVHANSLYRGVCCSCIRMCLVNEPALFEGVTPEAASAWTSDTTAEIPVHNLLVRLFDSFFSITDIWPKRNPPTLVH